MMATSILVLIVFCAQLLVIISVAAVADALGRVPDPRLRLTYWRGVALACVLLPLSAIIGPLTVSSGVTFSFISVVNDGKSVVSLRGALPAAEMLVGLVLCSGVLARLGWLCAGAVRLRQLRRRSHAVVLTPELEAIRSDVAPWAELRVSLEVTQPVGFGLSHPVVLLPDGFFAMDPEAQRAVACHELVHVARRDWFWIVVEEVARALFWFHPAVWWLVERIQESREQLVDYLVILRVPSKRAYMTALLAFADSGRPAFPATSFLRRRHLRSRLRKLVKEPVMSRRRFVCTAVALVCVVSGAVAGTAVVLPLGWSIGGDVAYAQGVADGKDPAVTLPKVISEVKPQYTREAMEAKIQGDVVMSVVVRTDGTTGEIEVTKSLDTEHGLDKQAVAALSQWRFEPGLKGGKPVPVRVTVEMRFTLKK
jgi:TonB family protein